MSSRHPGSNGLPLWKYVTLREVLVSLLQSTVMSLSQQTVRLCQGSQPAKPGSPIVYSRHWTTTIILAATIGRLDEVERKIIVLFGELDAMKSEDMLVAMPN